MKKLFVAVVLGALCLLAGCQGETAVPTDVVLVTLGGRNNPAVSAQEVSEYIQTAASGEGGSFSLVIADGSPYLAGAVEYGPKTSKNESHWTQELAERVEQGAALLKNRAQTEETDLIGGLEMSARQLQSGEGQEKILVVAHSGLSTVSPLAMQDMDLTDLDAAETVETLRQTAGLPDLTGVQVEWYFLGDTAGDQEAMSNSQRQSLKNFWEAYLKAGGAEEVNFRSNLPTQGEVEEAPYVSVVEADAVDLGQDLSLTVRFLPDSGELADPDEAQQQLTPVAQALTKDARRFLLVGTAADLETVNETYGQELSLARSRAVQSLLIGMGVPEDQISCVGIGKAHTSKQSQNQAENRAVFLTAADSPFAKEALGILGLEIEEA